MFLVYKVCEGDGSVTWESADMLHSWDRGTCDGCKYCLYSFTISERGNLAQLVTSNLWKNRCQQCTSIKGEVWRVTLFFLMIYVTEFCVGRISNTEPRTQSSSQRVTRCKSWKTWVGERDVILKNKNWFTQTQGLPNITCSPSMQIQVCLLPCVKRVSEACHGQCHQVLKRSKTW